MKLSMVNCAPRAKHESSGYNALVGPSWCDVRFVHPTSFDSLRKGLFPIRRLGQASEAKDILTAENFKNATTSGRCSGKTLRAQANNQCLPLASPAKVRIEQM